MDAHKNVYGKNYTLIAIFLILISVTFIIALFVTYSLTTKYVNNEFASKKIDVLEQTIRPYNDFFRNKIPEITFYQGYLDSASAAKYSYSVFHDYPFVKSIIFYNVQIGSHSNKFLHKNELGIGVKSIYQYLPKKGGIIGSKKAQPANFNDFKEMADKLDNFVSQADTSREPTQDEKFKTFYDIQPEKISYLNIPRREELKRYRALLDSDRTTFYGQNMMTFFLDQYALNIKNSHPELYQDISIRPVVYDPLDNENNKITTEVAFPGAFSDYKLYFSSHNKFLKEEILRRFMPFGGGVLLLYSIFVLIGWLIYRNMNTNLKLFKLQYDFINNFTHEFKTPISVIKIAGSNLKGDGELTERQRKHYGKILDEEADKLNDLMNKLLSLTQLENKSIKIKREEIDLEDFVKSYIETFSIKYPDFKLGYSIKDVSSFYTDPVMLGSIFQNLIENAFKYSNPSKKILFINIWPEKRNIIFSFADKGIGIAKDEVGNIFKKFYRIQNQYNQNGSVGLGLAFCKELANFMEGEITVESKINEGSEFIVTLPYET